MSETVIKTLRKDMASQGTDFATAEDVAKTVMRIASDNSINGEPNVQQLHASKVTAASTESGRRVGAISW